MKSGQTFQCINTLCRPTLRSIHGFNAMTIHKISDPLKTLLSKFGEIYATTSFYGTSRTPGPSEKPGENFGLSDLADLESGEPAVLVKVSTDGNSHIKKACNTDGTSIDNLTIMELPEDEYWFLEAFRPTLSMMSLGSPGLLYEMAFVNMYAVFESYISVTLSNRLRRMPNLISAKSLDATRRKLGLGAQPHEIYEGALELDVRKIMYGSISSSFAYMRGELNLSEFDTKYDARIQTIALIRNCLLHNGGLVDRRLAANDPSRVDGNTLSINNHELSVTLNDLRKVTLKIDLVDQLSR